MTSTGEATKRAAQSGQHVLAPPFILSLARNCLTQSHSLQDIRYIRYVHLFPGGGQICRCLQYLLSSRH
jgi:hypothetical protein